MSDTELNTVTATTEKRGRGRPKKESSNGTTAETLKNGGQNGQTSSPKKRGRKPVDNNSSAEPKSGPSDAKRGRGRPKGGKNDKSNKSVSKKGGKRGRPKKTESVEEEAAPLDEDLSASHEEEDEDDQ